MGTQKSSLSGRCAEQEFFIAGTARQWRKLQPCLVYDKRSKGSKGRVVAGPVRRFSAMHSGDRLEPSYDTPDVGVDMLQSDDFPKPAIFW